MCELISATLRKNDATTLVRLLHHTLNASQLRGLFDFKSWMQLKSDKGQNISKPHHFLFKRGDGVEQTATFYMINADDPIRGTHNFWCIGGSTRCSNTAKSKKYQLEG